MNYLDATLKETLLKAYTDVAVRLLHSFNAKESQHCWFLTESNVRAWQLLNQQSLVKLATWEVERSKVQRHV